MTQPESYPSSFDGLLEILARLRGPDGCPWDREQTRHSLKRQLVEEVYELLEAIDRDDADLMAEELGDVLLHLAYQLRMGEEAGDFRSTEVFAKLVEKLVRRHPHVFGGATARDARDVEASWEAIKRRERAETQDEDASMLQGVPKGMPSLAYAQTIQVRAARTGFDWDDYEGVLEKVSEELRELAETETEPDRERELGDLLFSLVNGPDGSTWTPRAPCARPTRASTSASPEWRPSAASGASRSSTCPWRTRSSYGARPRRRRG